MAISERPPEFYVLIDRVRFKGNRQRWRTLWKQLFVKGMVRRSWKLEEESIFTATGLNAVIARLSTVVRIRGRFHLTVRTEPVRSARVLET